MPIQLLCRKIGNTQIFVESGECIPVTVLQAGSNTVVHKKTEERDGYTALQLGFEERRPSRTTKPQAGHFQCAGPTPEQRKERKRKGKVKADAEAEEQADAEAEGKADAKPEKKPPVRNAKGTNRL